MNTQRISSTIYEDLFTRVNTEPLKKYISWGFIATTLFIFAVWLFSYFYKENLAYPEPGHYRSFDFISTGNFFKDYGATSILSMTEHQLDNVFPEIDFFLIKVLFVVMQPIAWVLFTLAELIPDKKEKSITRAVMCTWNLCMICCYVYATNGQIFDFTLFYK
ncbi:MAG: hypothetical protein WCO58_00980 [bacterium]